MSKWKTVWNQHKADEEILTRGTDKEILLELKRAIGNDVISGGIPYEGLINEFQQLSDMLAKHKEIKSVYEVGCGSGGNLWLYEKNGVATGGIDYSRSLIENAKRVCKSDDIVCGEAITITTKRKYDAVFAMRVFSYFENYEYAKQVLSKMCVKANYVVGLVDIHDKSKENDFLEFRRKAIKDYDERYAGLNKLFYDKSFFENIAKEYNMDISFEEQKTEGYWKNKYGYNVFLYHKPN